MVEDFSVDTFEALVGQTFKATPPGGEAGELTLSAAQASGDSPDEHRDPFSLSFREEGHEPKPQGLWSLQHDELGEFELFLVPHASDAAGVEYGAHFN